MGLWTSQQNVLDMFQSSISLSRPAFTVQAGNGSKSFSAYTISKAIYATGWDDAFDMNADAEGNWIVKPLPSSQALVNIITANVDELQELPGIGAGKAEAIVTYRHDNGKFNEIDDLDNVPGIGPALITASGPMSLNNTYTSKKQIIMAFDPTYIKPGVRVCATHCSFAYRRKTPKTATK